MAASEIFTDHDHPEIEQYSMIFKIRMISVYLLNVHILYIFIKTFLAFKLWSNLKTCLMYLMKVIFIPHHIVLNYYCCMLILRFGGSEERAVGMFAKKAKTLAIPRYKSTKISITVYATIPQV